MNQAKNSTDIFADIAKAGKEEQQKQQVDLGPITRLVDTQAMLEGGKNDDHVSDIYNFINEMDASIETLEEVMKLRKKDLFNVRQVQIPEMMKEFGLEEVRSTSGTSIKIMDGLSVTVKNADKLYQFLRDNEAGDLIKDVVIVMADADTEKVMKEVIESLNKIDCLFERKESVHNGTLKKYVKELLKEGKTVPEEAVNLYQYEYSKIKK